jgi:catechol 2,3-dioxygenase-like lactoylglutathione lyase family enzyme
MPDTNILDTSTAPLRGRLSYIEFGSPDPERLARFYADVFGATAERLDDRWLCRGPGRRLLFTGGAAKTLVSAGYAVADATALEGLATRLERGGVAAEAASADLFEPGALGFRDPDGNRTTYGVPRRDGAPPDAPPARLQHLVLGSTDAARMVDFYTGVVGLRESDRVLDEAGGLRTCFLRTDDEHHSFAVFQTSTNRLDHHCYELPDWNAIRDWGDRLAARRIPVKWGPGRHGPGNNLFLFFHDPDDNFVELSAELEVVAKDRPVGHWPHEERTLNSWGQGFLRT